MKLSEPSRYILHFDSTRILSVESEEGGTKFSGQVAGNVPKLYVISEANKPIYVGVTKQPIRARLRFGFRSKGTHGYYGYAWRHHMDQAVLDVWVQEEWVQDEEKEPLRDIETVEAEVIFLIRQEYGQWPEHQTEIHFHPSKAIHRKFAQQILMHFNC